MENTGIMSIKIYLMRARGAEPEIRRFKTREYWVSSFNIFAGKVLEVFPILSDKIFRIYWKDEEGDEIAISSDDELLTAILSMKGDVKKFIVRVEPQPNSQQNGRRNNVVHPGIICNNCECNIMGFRYNCVMCNDFDLCEICQTAGIHMGHPMLRIAEPGQLSRKHLQKVSHFMEHLGLKDKHRKHGHEVYMDDAYPESHKKHKRCDRRESETGDESEDGCHRKQSHHLHKNKKKGKCPYSQVMCDVLNFLPRQFQLKNLPGPCGEFKQGATDEFPHLNYLKTLGMTLQKFLDPLGVEVDFEVREDGEKKEEKQKEEPKKETPLPSPSAPPQKEVRFVDTDEATKEKVDEIAKLLAKQTMDRSRGSESSNSSKNGENDGWVELEELEKDYEESRPSGSTGAIPKVPQSQEKVPAGENKQQEASKAPNGQNLYPNLGTERTALDPLVARALDQMLSMGFTNDNNWLTMLLEAKRGNISQALDILDQQSRK